MARRPSQSGFTLIEFIVATLVAIIGVAAAFGFARQEVKSLSTQSEYSRAQSSAQLVLEVLARDIRNAGFGTSFYAGMPAGAFGGDAAVLDSASASRGFPAIRIANNVATAGAMPGSDAIALLRVTSSASFLVDAVPCDPGTSTYAVDDQTFANLSACIAGVPGGGLVLITDASRPTSEPEAMLLAVDPALSVGGAIAFRSGYGIDPSDAARCTNGSVPPTGAGAGATIVCVQPVSYWVDDRARLRVWQPKSDADASAATALAGAYEGRVPVNVADDAVLAEGVEDLQFAVRMSAEASASVRNDWAFAAPAPYGTIPTYVPGDESELSEARVVRISALVRTTRAQENRSESRAGLLAGGIYLEDHVMPATADHRCVTPATCYDPRYLRKLVSFQAEIRNMRLFDLLSDDTRTYDQMRSYRP